MIPHICYLQKIKETCEYTKKKQSHRYREQTPEDTGGY